MYVKFDVNKSGQGQKNTKLDYANVLEPPCCFFRAKSKVTKNYVIKKLITGISEMMIKSITVRVIEKYRSKYGNYFQF